MKKLTSFVLAVAILFVCCAGAFASQSQAGLYRNQLIGCYGRVTQDGNFRSSPEESGHFCGRAYYGESYLVYGITRADNGNYWYLVDISGYGYYAWISASLMDVNIGNCGYLSGYGYCIVTAKSCKARSGPGTSYGQAAMAITGNASMVYEIRYVGSKPWYRISVQGISCWVSSGLCAYYSY